MEFFMMKKTAIALGIAALTCGAQAAEVFKNADTAVEINLDLNFYALNINDTASAQARNYLQGNGTQLQFKTSKILNEDLTVFGQYEINGDPTADQATLITDDMKFGIRSKSMGTIQMGQFDTYMEDELNEIANSFLISNNSTSPITEPSMGSTDGRHLLYTHKIGDFAFGVDFTTSQNAAAATDTQNGVAYTVSYKLGDLKLVAGTATIARYTYNTAANANKAVQGFGASYALTSGAGLTKFAFLTSNTYTYSTNATYDGLENDINMVSINHTIGPWNFGVISNTLNMAATSSTVAAYDATENAYQVVYDMGKGAKLYVTNTNKGLTTTKGNFTEVGFFMSF
jgi:predicted porin